MRYEKLFRENFLHLLLYACLYSYTVVYCIRGRENRPTTKRKTGKNTMKKEMYDEIITVARENELAGILRVAVFDPDIMPSEFSKLAARVDTIKEKCEEIGK